jgi:crotonobetainyl-CoA:carnitine CoA-transferase CaiB-like acyl-CoA transferase
MLSLLQGVRILDFTTIVLGPYATQILGDLGADVIKVEPPDGDLFRSVRPGRSRQMGSGFLGCNRNKRSIAVDLKNPASTDLVHALVGKADVVVHNMRPRSAARLGLSYEELKEVNPRLVYAFAPGFDQRGRDAGAPAYDDIIQATSGLAHLNRSTQGEPRYLSTIVCDKVGGLHLALAVAAAVAYRARTGHGCCVEAPMFESTVSFLLAEQLGGEAFVPALGGTGYERLSAPNRRPFPTADGFVSILPYTTTHWTAFFELVGRPEQARSEIVRDPVVRSQNVDRLYGMIAEVTPTKTTAEWLVLLRSRDVPCARVNRLDELMEDPHLRDVAFFEEYEHPTEGRLRSASTPFHAHDAPTRTDLPPPFLNADARSILEEAGIPADRVRALAAAGVIRLDERG